MCLIWARLKSTASTYIYTLILASTYTYTLILNFTLLVKLFPFVVGRGQAICVIGEFHVICGSKSMPLTGPSKLRFLSGTLIDLFNIFTTSGAQHKRHLF